VVALNIPEALLVGFSLNKDLLLGALCASILAPVLYEFMSS